MGLADSIDIVNTLFSRLFIVWLFLRVKPFYGVNIHK